MKIVGAGSAFPKHVYSQQTITAALTEFWRDRLERPELLGRLHANCGVARRHLSMPIENYARMDTFGKTNTAWIETAEQLGSTAICRAITPHNIEPKDIDALFFTTVTGVSSPSIDARLVNRMTLNPQIKRMPLFGLGCVAGAAGIARAADYLRAFPEQIATVLSVELCSLTWQRDDLSTANLISTGLFGDGAAAVVLAGSDAGFDGPEILATRSCFYPHTEDAMGWDISERGFQIVLSPKIVNIIEDCLAADTDAFLAGHGLSRADIGTWIMHTGGPKILDAMAHALDLPENARGVFLGVPEACRQSLVGFRARGARRHSWTTPACSRNLQRSRRHGPGLLLRVRVTAMVTC
jgi:alkylresorcinol/alkylpyrone synthase